ncbi:MAG: ABC transporter permease [Bacteroidetes bacterium]|nr:ABC transporter permease [Bacteroidota bacterium]
METESIPFAIKLLRKFCPSQLLEEIEGDLLQQFQRDIRLVDERKAKQRLLWNAIRYCRPGILLRNKIKSNINTVDMLTNYLKVALRVMGRSKSYSFINLFSLALGITSFALLFIWIQQELSYDQFHADKDRLFKVWNRDIANGKINCWDVTPRVLAPTLHEEFAGVETAVSYAAWGEQHLFVEGQKRILKTSGAYADSSFLTMFSFPLIKGDARTAFKDPKSIAITETFARELFGDEEAMGKSVTIGEGEASMPVTITAVLKDLPTNTEFKFEYILPYSLVEMVTGKKVRWGLNSVYTYVKLREGVNADEFNELVKGVVKKHYKDTKTREVFLFPLTKMRLYSRFENGVQSGGRIEIIRLLGILGLALLVIACINFINLSTARAQRRSKEVAIRKVTGAFRHSLIAQFLCESMLLAFGAGLLSLGAVYLALPYFSTLVNEKLVLNFYNINFWLGGVSLLLLVGLLAGSYPAFYTSAFQPVKILKGFFTASSKSVLRTALVVFQFGIAITLMVSVFVVQRQIMYIQNRDKGYDKENLIYQNFTGTLGKNFQSYKNELLQRGIATSVTKTSNPITERWSNTDGIMWRGKDAQDKTLFERFYADQHLATTAGLTILRGRDMDLEKYSTDSTAVLLNEAAAKAMGFSDPIGEKIQDNGVDWHVIGIVKDFIFTSPFHPVEPTILFGCNQSWAFSVAHIKLNGNRPIRENLQAMEALSKKYNPDFPFEYEFVDDAYARKFASVETTRTITLLASFLTILIAGLGLLGLSTFMIEVRVKEIGIRKVMGGSAISITQMLTWASVKPILIALAIFSPLSWYLTNWWLSTYPFHISVGLFTIPVAGLTVIIMAIVITGTQTVRAAQANPVESLRNE